MNNIMATKPKKVAKVAKLDPNTMTVVERFKAPTPPFFKTLTTIGLVLTATGAVLTQGDVINLNPILDLIGAYMLVAGAVVAAISKITVNPE